jgi:hypothetical protein
MQSINIILVDYTYNNSIDLFPLKGLHTGGIRTYVSVANTMPLRHNARHSATAS